MVMWMTCMYFQHANKFEYQELPSHNGRTEKSSPPLHLPTWLFSVWLCRAANHKWASDARINASKVAPRVSTQLGTVKMVMEKKIVSIWLEAQKVLVEKWHESNITLQPVLYNHAFSPKYSESFVSFRCANYSRLIFCHQPADLQTQTDSPSVLRLPSLSCFQWKVCWQTFSAEPP